VVVSAQLRADSHCSAFAAEGAKVVLNGRTEARVAAALARIRKRLENADVQGSADLGTARVLRHSETSAYDILVNNLGILIKSFLILIPTGFASRSHCP
jgi:NADP-dependent 3-hydroxy acid dehydrogenase YdfG